MALTRQAGNMSVLDEAVIHLSCILIGMADHYPMTLGNATAKTIAIGTMPLETISMTKGIVLGKALSIGFRWQDMRHKQRQR